MSLCAPNRIIHFVPYLIGLVLIALNVLVALYIRREMLGASQDHGERSSMHLLLGLLVLSVLVVLFFAAFVVLKLAGDCSYGP